MAKFEKGKPRPEGAGRKPGVPNKLKSEMAKTVAQICAEIGFDPVKALIVAAAKSTREDIRVAASKELMKYMHPQKRSIEHSGSVDMQLQSIIQELENKTDEELKQIIKEQDE